MSVKDKNRTCICNETAGDKFDFREAGMVQLVKALTSHQSVPGLIPRPSVMWVEFVVGSLLCSERFFFGYSSFPSPQKPTFSNSNSILECSYISEGVLVTSWCFMDKQIT